MSSPGHREALQGEQEYKMPEFKMETIDAAFSYTPSNNLPATVTQTIQDNNKITNTQGFLIKKQIGEKRAALSLIINDTKTNLETNLLPQLTHPTSVKVTIDRNILGSSATVGEFVITDYAISDEFDEGNLQLVTIKVTEVITQ